MTQTLRLHGQENGEKSHYQRERGKKKKNEVVLLDKGNKHVTISNTQLESLVQRDHFTGNKMSPKRTLPWWSSMWYL